MNLTRIFYTEIVTQMFRPRKYAQFHLHSGVETHINRSDVLFFYVAWQYTEWS